MTLSLAERQSRLDSWESLANAALTVAADPAREAPALLLRQVEYASCWPWPRSSDTRCRALQVLLKVAVMTTPGPERAVLAAPLKALAQAVIEAVEAVRPPEPRRRLPYADA